MLPKVLKTAKGHLRNFIHQSNMVDNRQYNRNINYGTDIKTLEAQLMPSPAVLANLYFRRI